MPSIELNSAALHRNCDVSRNFLYRGVTQQTKYHMYLISYSQMFSNLLFIVILDIFSAKQLDQVHQYLLSVSIDVSISLSLVINKTVAYLKL